MLVFISVISFSSSLTRLKSGHTGLGLLSAWPWQLIPNVKRSHKHEPAPIQRLHTASLHHKWYADETALGVFVCQRAGSKASLLHLTL